MSRSPLQDMTRENGNPPLHPNAGRIRVRRKKARPSELLDAALVLFARKGFHATSMEEIGVLANVSKATVHLYFGSKERIFTGAVQSVIHPLLQQGELAVGEWRGSMSSLLRHLVVAWIDIARTNPVGEVLKLMFTEGSRFPALAHQGEALINRVHTLTANLIERGIRSGEFHPCDAATTAYVLLAPLGFHEVSRSSNGVFGKTGEPDASYFTAYLEIVLGGIQARDASASRNV